MTAEQALKIVEEIQKYINSSHAYLSESQPYARGYKEGIGMVKHIISGIIEKVLTSEE